jgi:hypothetical protein
MRYITVGIILVPDLDRREIQWGDMEWTVLSEVRDQCKVLVNMAVKTLGIVTFRGILD